MAFRLVEHPAVKGPWGEGGPILMSGTLKGGPYRVATGADSQGCKGGVCRLEPGLSAESQSGLQARHNRLQSLHSTQKWIFSGQID